MKYLPVWLAAAVMVGLFPAAAAAQLRERESLPGEPPPIYATGTDIFRYLFHRAGIEPISAEEFVGDPDASETILVVLGDEQGSRYVQWAETILRDGGAVLIATDSPFGIDGLPFLSGGQQVSSGQEGTYLPGHTECPFAVPLAPPGGRSGPEWELFAGLDRIATNRPSYFTIQNRSPGLIVDPIAGFPRRARVDGRAIDFDPGDYPLAVGASRNNRARNPFRLLAVADPSVFVNEMMVPVAGEPTQNIQFADRVVKFLAKRDDGSRRPRCLFVENGVVVSDFSSLQRRLAPPPPPIRMPDFWQLQDKIVDAGNQIIDKFQDNGGPSTLVMGRDRWRQNEMLRRVLRALLVIGSICAVWFLVRRVWRARQPTDIPPAPPGGRAQPDSDRPFPGVFQRRQREVLRRNNLHEPVRMALREFFAGTRAPDTGPKLPKVVIADVVRRPETLRKALQDLWRIAYGPPAVLTIQKWKLLEPLFDRIQKAHADGKWRFVVSEESMARNEA